MGKEVGVESVGGSRWFQGDEEDRDGGERKKLIK